MIHYIFLSYILCPIFSSIGVWILFRVEENKWIPFSMAFFNTLEFRGIMQKIIFVLSPIFMPFQLIVIGWYLYRLYKQKK